MFSGCTEKKTRLFALTAGKRQDSLIFTISIVSSFWGFTSLGIAFYCLDAIAIDGFKPRTSSNH